jgi:hypothetical protein
MTPSPSLSSETPVCQHGAKLRVALSHVLPLRGFALGRKVIPPDARRSDQVLSVTSFRL